MDIHAMTPPPIIYVEDSEVSAGHDPLQAWVDGQPGAVPYMLARPQPIETAPRDGEERLAWWHRVDGEWSGRWHVSRWSAPHGQWIGWRMPDKHTAAHQPRLFLPLPPAPEEA